MAERELNLVPAIKAIEAQINDKTYRFQQELKPLNDSLIALRKINTVCERCYGKGKVLRSRSCAEDDIDPSDPNDYVACLECHGFGRVLKEGSAQSTN